MGNYCSSVTNTNQQVVDYLRNKVYEIHHQKILDEVHIDWKFDTFWKKRLVVPKILKDRFTFEDMTFFINSFPEMKKNRNQKLLKDHKKWPYTCIGIVKSKFHMEYDYLKDDGINNDLEKDQSMYKDLESYLRSRNKEILGSGFLIGNSVVLTLLRNIYLKDKINENKERDKKADEVKFYAFFNGSTGIECEVESIHHLEYQSISDIYDDIALLFLKKPVGEELGFLGIWDKIDFSENQVVEVVGYLYDDIYENKIFLNEMKIPIKSDKVKYDVNKLEQSSIIGKLRNDTQIVNEEKFNKKSLINPNDEEFLENRFFKSFSNINIKTIQNQFLNGDNNLNNRFQNTNFGENTNVYMKTEETTQPEDLHISKKNNCNLEYFYFQSDQIFNLLPGAGIWANKQNKSFLLGLYLGKHEKSHLHYGIYLHSSINNIKEWILDYWYENKKENTRLLMCGEEFKIHKAEALHIIVNRYNKLNCLILNESGVTDEEILLLMKNLNLRVLKLRNNNLTTNSAIHIANNQRNIEELDLSNNNIGYVGIKEIVWKLKKIKILYLEKLGLKDNALADIGANLIDLCILDISKNFITNEGVINISKGNVNLSELNLGGNEQITDEAINYLAENLLKIKTLLINETGITDCGISSISEKLIFIQKLNLGRCNVSEFGMNKVINRLKYLHSLNILHCNNLSDDFKRNLIKSKIIKNLII